MQLRYYQSEACEAVWNHLKSDSGNPLIVLPTGAGKSLVVGKLVAEAVHKYQGRVVVLQHRKELIQQNANKIRKLSDCSVGIFSAGLGRKQINEDCIVAGSSPSIGMRWILGAVILS